MSFIQNQIEMKPAIINVFVDYIVIFSIVISILFYCVCLFFQNYLQDDEGEKSDQDLVVDVANEMVSWVSALILMLQQ